MNFSSLSGTNRTLDKLPITAEIFNKTLLDDLAVIDVVNLLNNYATGVGPGEAGAGGPAATGTQDGDRFGLSFYTVRGLAVGPLRGDGFLSGNNLGEAFAYDRVEIIRGPQSLLYGANPAGGIINLSTKRANFGRTFYQPQVEIDSLDSERYQLDANVAGHVLNRRVALRTALLDSTSHPWRQNLQRTTTGQYIDFSVELLAASHTTLRLSAESKVNEGIEALSGALVTGIPSIVPNSSKLVLLLARNDPALANIANGFVSWNVVDSLAGNSQLSRRIERHSSATLTSQFTPWLQGQRIVAKEPLKLDRLSPSGGARHDILGRLIHDKWEERAV